MLQPNALPSLVLSRINPLWASQVSRELDELVGCSSLVASAAGTGQPVPAGREAGFWADPYFPCGGSVLFSPAHHLCVHPPEAHALWVQLPPWYLLAFLMFLITPAGTATWLALGGKGGSPSTSRSCL